MNELYFVETAPRLEPESFDRILSCVSEEKRRKIVRFRFDADKKTALYADVLVRCLICRALKIKNDDIRFERNEYGKPRLAGHADFHYSVSHTKCAVAVCVSDGPVGVDAEKIREIDPRIARRVFTENETAYVAGGENGRRERFFRVWTGKEAFVKQAGKGFFMDMKSFDVIRGADPPVATILTGGYALSVCPCQKLEEEDLIRITEPELVQMTRRYLE